MPRYAREQSITGVYHVILRGVNKQQIFECSEDYERFLAVLRAQTQWEEDNLGIKQKPHCVVYSYCLMGNHVHILLKEVSESVGETIKRISSSYVYHYNHKYNRVGHLFQERFKSQPVSDWTYFLTLIRYIHQNPLKPHLVKDLSQYPWSSWSEFMGTSKQPFCSISRVLERINLEELRELVEQPLTADEEDGFLDVGETPAKNYFTDEEAWALIKECSGTSTLTEFQSLSRPIQKYYLWLVHEKGVGPRALSRISGVPYSIVQRATSAENERMLHSSMLRETSAEDEEYYTYCDQGCFEQYPEY